MILWLLYIANYLSKPQASERNPFNMYVNGNEIGRLVAARKNYFAVWKLYLFYC